MRQADSVIGGRDASAPRPGAAPHSSGGIFWFAISAFDSLVGVILYILAILANTLLAAGC
jgi:hypothetical protein